MAVEYCQRDSFLIINNHAYLSMMSKRPTQQGNGNISLSWKSGSSLCQEFAHIANKMAVLFADERCTLTPERRMIYCSSTNIAASVPTVINYTTLLLESAPVCLYVVYWLRTWTCVLQFSTATLSAVKTMTAHSEKRKKLGTSKKLKTFEDRERGKFFPFSSRSPFPHQPPFTLPFPRTSSRKSYHLDESVMSSNK